MKQTTHIDSAPDAEHVESGDENELMLHVRFLSRVLLVLFFAHSIFLWRAFEWQIDSRMWVNMLGVCIVVIGYVLLRLTRAYLLIAHAALLTSWIAVTNGIYTSGGFHSTTLVWLLVIPLLSVLLVGGRQAAIWGALCTTVFLFFAISQYQGIEYADLTPVAHRFSQSFIHFIAAMSVLSLVGSAFARAVERYRDSVNIALERQQQEIAFRRDAEQAALNHSKAKSSFLASVSHELRTPLNSVIGFSRRVLQSRELSERNRDALEIINKNGLYLLEVINDLLDLNKIEAGKMELDLEECNVSDIVRSVIDSSRLELGARELSLDCSIEADCMLIADPVRVRQIVGNLISNAIKYTDEGCVTVTLGNHEQNHEQQIEFMVKDTGQGISAEMQQYLFDEYTAAAAKSHRLGQSTGLGLPLTYKLVQLHAGEFILNSEPGVGTTVVVKLPKRQAK